jgi:aldehyde:ferredoxin oxidoreductase
MAFKETKLNHTDKIAHRLALLEGVDLSKADLEFITNEIEDLERVLAKLEDFGQETPWVSQQVQPAGKKA